MKKITQKKLSATLKKVLLDFGNEEALDIAKVLLEHEGERITDEMIAEESGVKINIARKILYTLNENDLTKFHRVRDKRSGWYVYFWEHNFDNLENMIHNRREQVIEKLQIRLNYEESNLFFTCKSCDKGERYTFFEATDLNFLCPHCNGPLTSLPNDDTVNLLKKTIAELRAQQNY